MEYLYKELVQGGKKGDRHCKEQLLCKLMPLMLSLYNRYGRGLPREDFLQSLRLSVLELVESFDPGYNVPFLGFVKTRLRYAAMNMGRKNPKPWTILSLDQPAQYPENMSLTDRVMDRSPGPEEIFLLNDDRCRLAKGLDILTAKQRRVVYLYYFKNIPLKEISRNLNIHYQAVLSLKARAIQRLRKYMVD
ncbi:MAG: sigma-70 family RNA polymerase sigma factor [Mahellales bacterium]|jgi:RNA polymerase sigma factor (sigma-70 family)